MAGKRIREPSKPPAAAKKKKVSARGGRNSSVHQIKRFPIQDIHQLLETKFPSGTVKSEGAVFLTGVLEYLGAEILELSTDVARARISGKSGKGTGLKVTLEDMLQAIESDAEIKQLIDKVRTSNSEKKKS